MTPSSFEHFQIRHGISLRTLDSRDGGSVSVKIGNFWGIGIGWTKTHRIGIGISISKYRYFLGYRFGKNNTDLLSLLDST